VNAVKGRHKLVGSPAAPSVTVGARSTTERSPILPILGGLVVGVLLAVAMLLGPASGGSEPLVTGSVLFAFGFGWGLIAWLTSRFSAQPQTWAAIPALFLGSVGLVLIVFQPGPGAMDLMSWVWPPVLAILAVWMLLQVRRHLRGRGRWLVVPVIAALLAFAVGGASVTLSLATRPGAAASSGQMVDIGGHRLYLECTGSGSPTVVLQAGLGEASSSWARIAPGVASSTRVCAYDRAGHGRSDEAGPQDGIALAADLHTLLVRAGVPGPYVLVGHSSGGAYVRVFAERYPDEVTGMVLLDSQPADAFRALPDYPDFYQNYRRVGVLSPSLARIGLLGPMLGLTADQSTPAAARGGRDEILALPVALDQARALTSIGDRPLVVVSAGSGQQTGWLDAQAELPRLSTNSRHRIVDTATHTSLISGADAPASTQAILDVLAAIQSGTALR
jgi:pimeloyl-ACP methyl ester carboxylesterase